MHHHKHGLTDITQHNIPFTQVAAQRHILLTSCVADTAGYGFTLLSALNEAHLIPEP